MTYDLLASSPASMLKYGFYGGVVSSSAFHLCSYYFARFIYMSPELVFNNALTRVKKNDRIDSILGIVNAEPSKSYSVEAGGISLVQGIYVRPKMSMKFKITSNRGHGEVTLSATQSGTKIIYDHISVILNDGQTIVIDGLDK